MTQRPLTKEEHTILWLEAAMTVLHNHPDIKDDEISCMVTVEMHSMDLTQARDRVYQVMKQFHHAYQVDRFLIKDE